MAPGKTRHTPTKLIEHRKGDEDAAKEISVTSQLEIWPLPRAKESAIDCRFQMIAFDIPAYGLAFDFRGEPFGSTPDLARAAVSREDYRWRARALQTAGRCWLEATRHSSRAETIISC